jgi:uncharacterized protein YabE (DUF348 family)
MVCAGSLIHPSPALAGSGAIGVPTAHVVTFDSLGSVTQNATGAPTVAAFLQQRGIAIGPNDFVSPSADTPISDRLTIAYRAAIPVTIVTAKQKRRVVTTADDVGSMLEQQGIALGRNDQVTPALDDRVPANGVVRIVRVLKWQHVMREKIAAPVVRRLDFAVAPGSQRVLSKGAPGVKLVMVGYTQRDGGSVTARVVATHVIRRARPRVLAVGVGEYDAFERFAQHGVNRASKMIAQAITMVATAYTANCAGCSGITAIGRPAGHGIVAVDPNVIPLGTRLYSPGYGFAIAGDTGGAIVGNRIDLGFDSYSDAMRFGRRELTVYRLK